MAKKGGGTTKVTWNQQQAQASAITRKRAQKATEKLKMKKYDPWALNPETGKKGMHVDFEKKMPPAKKQ